ncbi:MAG: hypothetical protein KGY80_06290 [Candidatus Thorarchaeota archaeon]|nr:hypothetical protein [Candidatus Thorarchaeota archaeon]
MVNTIKRTIRIIQSNYPSIRGACVFTSEGKIAFQTENMQLGSDASKLLQVWRKNETEFTIKHITFVTALRNKNSFVAINPSGATSIICGTGRGTWYVAVFVPMDEDKNSILKECQRAAKSIASTTSIFSL